MPRTLSDAIATYRTLAAAEGKSPRTIYWVVSSARLLQRFLGPEVPLEFPIQGY